MNRVIPSANRRLAVVVGGGPTGLLAALALSRADIATTLVTPTPPPPGTGGENRTTALFAPSITMLENLEVWAQLKASSAPLRAIRILDDRQTLLRAPEVLFSSSDVGLDAFGYNVPNAALGAVLRQALANRPNLEWIQNTSVVAVKLDDHSAHFTLSDGRSLTAAVIIAADGSQSLCRQAAGIQTRAHAYDQIAITTWFRHSRPHTAISTEFHRTAGPCTTVPLPGDASSLVWVERPAIAQRLLALDDRAFIGSLEQQLKGLLGSVSNLAPRGSFPLKYVRAERLAGPRVLLIGEAAHVMPPLGAQGLNLGFRDVAVLVDCLRSALNEKRDPGERQTGAAYETARSADMQTRMGVVDGLNRSLLTSLAPLHWARGAGMHLLAALPTVKRALINQGIHPAGPVPRLMRPPDETTRAAWVRKSVMLDREATRLDSRMAHPFE